MEKNWVFFERGEKLLCIYSNHPEQVIIEVAGSKVVGEYKTPEAHWKWGYMRGGAAPMPHDDGHLLRFFHTRMDNEPPPVRHRYYVGCCLMTSAPPFAIARVCKEPIIRGSEIDDRTELERSACLHWKGNVAFPSGCVRSGPFILLALGINDCQCAVARLSDEHLKLS